MRGAVLVEGKIAAELEFTLAEIESEERERP
jgi:hypothetical protein